MSTFKVLMPQFLLGLSQTLPEYNNRIRDFLNQDQRYALALENKVFCAYEPTHSTLHVPVKIYELYSMSFHSSLSWFSLWKIDEPQKFLIYCIINYLTDKKVRECPLTAADNEKNNLGKFQYLLERVRKRTDAVRGKHADCWESYWLTAYDL